MTPSLNVDEETKDRLEELQAEIRLRTGREVTQTELLRQIVDRGYESRGEIIDSFNESAVPLSEDEKAAMQRGRFSSGNETTESDVDDVLYD
ncbi:hypothetical protein [Halonotius roseus]|uniref:Uncharacterized protein n=1 Tax=Halonotius roseus TaxID=2511997 RepID=A0A544QNC5_9EURY|nr:hypothetical protein [Halonotius roseus]TQQ80421.1 hypothetical protein EWF95_08000 [Halonotius roseus]